MSTNKTCTIRLFIPSRDRDGNEFGTQRLWELRATRVICRITGGATLFPGVEGIWLDERTGELVHERSTVVFAYVERDRLEQHRDEILDFVETMGRETRQQAVAAELDGVFHVIAIEDEGDRAAE